jgi:hypothetical protein
MTSYQIPKMDEKKISAASLRIVAANRYSECRGRIAAFPSNRLR